MQLLEKGIIITNKYEDLFSKDEITVECLIDIINSIMFVKDGKEHKLMLKATD